jgi:hypothetical protein
MDGEKIYRHGGRENFGENKRKNPNLNPLTLSRPPFPKKKNPKPLSLINHAAAAHHRLIISLSGPNTAPLLL